MGVRPVAKQTTSLRACYRQSIWEFRSRLGYEYWICKCTDGTWGDQQGRPRLRLQARYALSEQTTLLTSVEPLINALPSLVPNTFGQNQTYLGWGYDWPEHFTS